MKRLLFMMILVLSSVGASSQLIADVTGYLEMPEDSVIEHDQWYLIEGIYVKFFDKTPMGYSKGSEELITILKDNKLNVLYPDVDNSTLAPYVVHMFDFGHLHTSVSEGTSEIIKVWVIPYWKIIWKVDQSACQIMLFNIE